MPMGLPGPSGAHLGRSARRKVVKSRFIDDLWGTLGHLWVTLGPLWDVLGTSWEAFGAPLGPCGGLLGSFLDVFGRCLAPSRGDLWPKSEQSVNSLNPPVS